MAFLVVMASSALSIDLLFGTVISTEIYWSILAGVLASLATWGFLLSGPGDRSLRVLAWTQLLIDVGVASAVVALTGGLFSAFILLYGLNALTAAILLFHRGALASATLSFVAFSAVVAWTDWALLVGDSSAVMRWLFVGSVLVLLGGVVARLVRKQEELYSSLQKTSQDLEDLSALQSSIVESMPSGLLFLGPDAKVLYANPVADKILGTPLRGEEVKDEGLRRLFDTPGAIEEVHLNTHRGERNLRVQSLPVSADRILLVLEDVSLMRELEGKVRLQERLATAGTLAAGLAHEIKNPLASLSGSIQLLHRDRLHDEETEKLMRIVLRETDRLDELLQNFLNYAKPSTPQLKDVHLKTLIESSLALIRLRAESEKKSIEFRLDVPESISLRADENQLKQILWNLVGNAITATESKGVIGVKAVEMDSEWVELEVSDTGPGMTKETIHQIFEPFYSKKMTGIGLGLALVYQIVQAHEAQIEVESEPGQGSSFRIRFLKKGPKQKVSDSRRQVA